MTELQRQLSDRATSAEGHAAKSGMGGIGDDRWVEIQRNTFTNWMNEQLKPTGKKVEDISEDLENGLLLISLTESLIETRGGALQPTRRGSRYSKNPTNRIQKMENVSYALSLMEKEGIKLVNIGNEDVVDGKLKLILGLLWKMILKYQISGSDGARTVKVPPKKLMMEWIRAVLPDLNIKNFSSDWTDGVALSALIEHCQPGLCPNWKSLDRSNRLDNCSNAMKLGKEHFDIPLVLSPEDMSSGHIDELSGMTYLSYYLKKEGPGWFATLNWVRKKVPELNVQNFQSDWNDGVTLCALANSCGGVCPEWSSLDRENPIGNCQTGIEASKKLQLTPLLTAQELANPEVDELAIMAYAASFRHAQRPAPKYAELVDISLAGIAISKEDNETGVRIATVGKPVSFAVALLDKNAKIKDIAAVVEGPTKSCPVKVDMNQDIANKGVVTFTPSEIGRHKVTVYVEGNLARGTPFDIMVKPDTTPKPNKVHITGGEAVVVGDVAIYTIDASEAGDGSLEVTAGNGYEKCPVTITQNGKNYTVTVKPKEAGSHVVNVKWAGQNITGSPFSFMAMRREDPVKLEVVDAGKVTTHGDGLHNGQEGQPASFTVDPRMAGKGDLNVQVEGPNSIAKCSVDPNADGTYKVTYVPVETGMFTIKVLWATNDVQGSPFHPKIIDPRKVRCVNDKVPAMDSSGCIILTVGRKYSMPLECFEAGPGALSAEVQSPNGTKRPMNLDKRSDGTYDASFVPDEEGEHLLHLYWSGLPTKNSPYKAMASREVLPIDHSKVLCSGKGLKYGRVNDESEFIIDGSLAGPGEPRCTMSGLKGDVPITITPIGNDVHRAKYTPLVAGAYLLHLTWSDRQVEGSPFKVSVAQTANAGKVVVTGAGVREGIVGQPVRAVIDTKDAGPGQLTARCMGPRNITDVDVIDNHDGTFTMSLRPEEPGRHMLEIKYGGDHINGSPFIVRVAGPPDATKVKCFGTGMEHGILATYNGRFVCETRGAGAGQLKVRIHGPKGAFKVEMTRDNQKDRTILVKYNPTEVGEYTLSVRWSDKHIPGSPFEIKIVDTQEELEEVKRRFPLTSSISNDQNGWQEEI
ncbi:filamin-A-like [Saccoglossus kowalevskii]|uniref:Filamin-C-like n=1 Tax=Saccoglossus kowalevskii TaxID=10224 RepID=A0ABM0MTU9_SACKO|nr:PREDICTED: filamin-C-like [Saccoglossus kowalevskii]